MIQQLTMQQLKEKIGKEIIRSAWYEVTQEDINKFADCTNDHQWIHVDEERSSKGPFGEPIAHGFFILALMAQPILEQGVAPIGSKMMVNCGLNRLRFINPVVAGSEIRLVGTLAAVEDKGQGRVLMTVDASMEIKEMDKPAFVAEFLLMHFCGEEIV